MSLTNQQALPIWW